MAIQETWLPLPGHKGFRFSNFGKLINPDDVIVPRGRDGSFRIDDGYGSTVAVNLPVVPDEEPAPPALVVPSDVESFINRAKATKGVTKPVDVDPKRESPLPESLTNRERIDIVETLSYTFRMPTSYLTRIKLAAGWEPVSSWVRRAIEEKLNGL